MNNSSWPGYLSLIAMVIALVAGFAAFTGKSPQAGTTANQTSTAGYYNAGLGFKINGSVFITGAGSGRPPAIDAGLTKSYTNSTSTTATSETLAQSDILGYDTIFLNPTGGAVTLTLPATSTLTTLVPTAGDRQDTCIFNASSTAGINITLAAGTGIDLDIVATSTITSPLGVLKIGPNNSGCLTFIRQASTDISALLTVFGNAD